MNRRIMAFLAVIVLLLSIPVMATASARAAVAITELSFDGTTAICNVIVTADYTNHRIAARIGLYDGDECVASWFASDYGLLDFSETATVVKGREYVLVADLTINGVVQPTVTQTATCE